MLPCALVKYLVNHTTYDESNSVVSCSTWNLWGIVKKNQKKSKKDSWDIAYALAWVHFFFCAKDVSFFRVRVRCDTELSLTTTCFYRPSTARCGSGVDCLYRHRMKLEQRLLLTTSRPIKHSRLRFCLAWFLQLAAAKVTKSRSWPPHVFAQDFFRWHFECVTAACR